MPSSGFEEIFRLTLAIAYQVSAYRTRTRSKILLKTSLEFGSIVNGAIRL
jgi:hypothetical protein